MKTLAAIAQEFKVQESTVSQLLEGLHRNGGRQVQFNIAELGGMGQWQAGGMVMVGDMFNNELKAKVDKLCRALVELPVETENETFVPIQSAVGSKRFASIKGSQNGISYAYYQAEDILEITDENGLKKYDTKGYLLTGVQQSQSNDARKLSFSYAGGSVEVEDLKEVSI